MTISFLVGTIFCRDRNQLESASHHFGNDIICLFSIMMFLVAMVSIVDTIYQHQMKVSHQNKRRSYPVNVISINFTGMNNILNKV